MASKFTPSGELPPRFAKDPKDDRVNRLLWNFRNGKDRPWSPGNSLSPAERVDNIGEVVREVEKLSLHPHTSTNNSKFVSDHRITDDDLPPSAFCTAQSGGHNFTSELGSGNSPAGKSFFHGGNSGGGNTQLPTRGNNGGSFRSRKGKGKEGEEEGDSGGDSSGAGGNRSRSTGPGFDCPAIKSNTKKEDIQKECQTKFRTEEEAR